VPAATTTRASTRAFQRGERTIAARSSLHDERTVIAMSAQELLSALVTELPAPAPVEPLAFLDDDLLPLALAPVEPTAFALACAQALWGARGPRN
jgi:hypothetical protein